MAPIFSAGCKYRHGEHDLDLGRVDCVFDTQNDARQTLDDLIANYKKDGWRLIQGAGNRLVFRKGSKCVEVEFNEAVHVIVSSYTTW